MKTLEEISRAGLSRPFKFERQADGRYTIFDRPISEPHNYDGDIFTKARQDAILNTTRSEEPAGGVWVGHPGFGDTEAPITGTMTNYRESKMGLGRHIADWVDIEPPAFLDIVLGRWKSYSIEYRLPNLDAYTGVALLGRSQAFFPFARLNPPKLNDEQMNQLRQDAESWPKTMAARSVSRSNTDPKGTRDMKKTYRQIMKDGTLVWQVQETDEKNNVREWRNLREGETVDKSADEDMGKIRSAVEEIGTRMGNLESRMEKVEESIGGGNDDGEEDDAGRGEPGDDEEKKKDDEGGRTKPAGKRTVVKANDKGYRALEARMDKAERQSTRTKFDAKIDTLVSAGAVIDKASRSATLDAVMAADEAKRDEVFEALTKSVRTAPLSDEQDGQITDPTDPDFAQYEGEELKGLRTYFDRLGPNARKAAKKELKEYNAFRKSNPSAHGVEAGPLNWLEAIINPAEHDAA